MHSPASRSSQFFDQVPCGHATHGSPSNSYVERNVPGGQMLARYVHIYYGSM